MRILVVGGTRYFGIPMVNALLEKGHDVTIGTRGNTKVNFKGDVSHVIFDRTDSTSVKRALDNRKYDVIIDKIAYSSNDVKNLLENVSCERYIQMSTCSVYHKDHANISEDEFVASEYPLEWMDRITDYAKTKRYAERAALEFMDCSECTFVRYPIVLGENDYTGRLRFYIEHINDERPMFVDDLNEAMSFIQENEAGEFLAFLADYQVNGAVNGCSNGVIKISEIISYIEEKVGKKAIIDENGDAAPFNGLKDTLSFSTQRAKEAGYVFSDLDGWIYKLIDFEISR